MMVGLYELFAGQFIY